MLEEKIADRLQDFFLYFSRWMKYQYKNAALDDSFTLAQYKVLFLLNRLQVCNMSSLSEAMEVSKGTMTSMLNKLVEEGYVERRGCLEDRRNVYVQLSEKGKVQVGTVELSLLQSMVSTLQGVNEDKQKEIFKALEILINVFKEK
ncbi:MarR family winged helix-turn-helix transcriptional regulator [Alkaliphilus metalliredigens]|uniref:MarR family winged helix-turn-helix transcriptional regulator n=1 Tax=Alkaliphilus metalliredigens TaxID=208226 RepID=UPI0012EE3BF7|nr:MarR family transcriptional regulator [Alkaliphilus metalliredigens]